MKNPKALWESCQKYIAQNVKPEEYEKWFSGIELESYNESTKVLKLWVPSSYISEYVETHYLNLLRTAFINTFGRIQLFWHPTVASPEALSATNHNIAHQKKTHGVGPVVEADDFRDVQSSYHVDAVEQTVAAPAKKTTHMELPDIDTKLNPHQTFRNFIEGESNKLCRSVGLSVAEHPNTTQFNPMFIYGPSGCGKTHLINAIGVHCKERYPKKRVLYVTARIFQLQFTNAFRNNKTNDFIGFYQTMDMLIVDDVQEWGGGQQKATIDAFFHIFNHLTRTGKQIILASDRPPVQLEGLPDRMLTRFACGLVAEMEKPNVQLCIDILKRKIARDGLHVPNDVVEYIAQNANGSVRELEGVINSLMAYSVVYNSNIDMKLVERVVKRAINVDNEPVTIDSIIHVVCEQYNVTEVSLKGRTRKREVVQPRQLVMYLADKYVRMPASRIGRIMGGRDHSTVGHSIQQVEQRIKLESDFKAEVLKIEKELKVKE